MRIVVTGAKGFIGSVFSLRAIEHGHDVIALDDGSRGLNPTEDRIGSAFRQFDCLHGIKDAVEGPIDAVVHLAAATGSLERPLDVPDSPYVVSKERALTWLRQVDGAADGGAGIGIPVRFFNVAGAYKG